MSDGRESGDDEELGFSKKDLCVEQDTEKNDICISGKQDADSVTQISPVSAHDETTNLSRQVSHAPSMVSRVVSRLTTSGMKDPGPPPDGGLQAWTQCFCGWLVMLNTWGFVNSFGAFQTHYTETLPQPPSTISWIGSVQAFLMFFLGVFSGRALDAGLFRPTIIVGIIFQLVGVFTMSLATKYWHLILTQGILTGIGGGIFFCPVLGLMSTYFEKKRGMALGIATTGNSMGGIIYTVIVRQLLPKIGFGWTVRVLGLLNLVTLSIVIAFMKPRLPPRKSGPIFDISAIKDIPYVLFVLGVCFLMAGIYFVFYYIASYATDVVGLPYTSSLNLVIILNGIGIPARVLPGFIADRYIGVLNTFIPILFVNILLLFSWLGVKNIAGFYAFTVLYGLFAAGWQSLFPTAVASLGNDLSKAGTRLGMAFSVISVFALVGGPIGGAILQADGRNYHGPIIWTAMITVLGTCLVVSARIASKGKNFKIKC